MTDFAAIQGAWNKCKRDQTAKSGPFKYNLTDEMQALLGEATSHVNTYLHCRICKYEIEGPDVASTCGALHGRPTEGRYLRPPWCPVDRAHIQCVLDGFDPFAKLMEQSASDEERKAGI